MPGKFINEITSDAPAKDDLAIFFDKSKNATAQASVAELVNAGLDITTGTKGQVPTIDTKVDPVTGLPVNSITWGAGGGIDFKGTTSRPANGTDEVITSDPVSGLPGKTTVQQLMVAGGIPAVTGADAGKQLTVQAGGTMGWTSDTSDLPAFTVADKGKQLTVKADGKTIEWVETIPAATKDGQILTYVGNSGSIPPVAWADPELPTITDGLTALQTKADKSGVEWVESVNLSTNLKGGFTAGAFFPVNDTKADTTRFVDAATYRRLVGVPEQLYFPNWTPTNDQVGAGWNDMGVALARMASVFLSDTFAGSGSLAKTAANSFPGSNSFYGAVLTPNGKVFCVPSSVTKAYIYDIATGNVSQNPAVFPGNGAYYGGVLLPNGKVFCVPHNTTAARIYDPVADTVTVSSAVFPGSGAYAGGVLLPNGKVFCVPHNATAARIYDPATDSISTSAGAFPGSNAYSGGVLLPDGKVFCVPYNANAARVYDPVSDSVSVVTGAFPGSGAYYGGVLLPNGKVFCVPHNTTAARIYDPVAGTVTVSGAVFPGGYKFQGGALLPNGKVFCVPSNVTSALIYDYLSDSVFSPSQVYPGGGAYGSAALMPNGKLFLCPLNATQAGIVDYSSTVIPSIPSNMCLSPFYNKL